MSAKQHNMKVVQRRYADIGVRLGESPDADIVMKPAAYSYFLNGGMGIGTSYQLGLWREGHMTIQEFTKKRIKGRLIDKPGRTMPQQQSFENAPVVARRHYDAGNDYFEAILDPYMQYSCARFDKGARNLAEAQICKLESTGQKQRIKQGELVLDIGCGFGGLLHFYHDRWGARGIGVTLSKEQAEFARERNTGLPIEILLEDYRQLLWASDFHHVVSVGMFEHVGPGHYRTFFETCKRVLKPGGDLLLHSIFGLNEGGMDPWLEANIFPGGELPTRKQVENAIRGLFVPMDWHKIGASYAPTLMAWNRNLRHAWPQLLAAGYGEQFLRTQDYFHQECAARFETGIITVYQVHLFHEPVDAYQPIR